MSEDREPDSEAVRAAVFEIIENQIRDGTPPETKETYDRLIAARHSHEETMKLLGCVIGIEISDTLNQKQLFDEDRYVAALHALPELPCDDDDE